MPNVYDLSGKRAVVTGGARGIGRAIAARFVASGADVCVWDLSRSEIDGVQCELVDVTKPAAIAAGLEKTFPGNQIDILVNDAGYLGAANPFESHADDDWHRIVSVNLLGTIQVTQAALPRLRCDGGGRIINLGSLAGKEGLPGLTVYSAASGGVIAFTKALSRELVNHSRKLHSAWTNRHRHDSRSGRRSCRKDDCR